MAKIRLIPFIYSSEVSYDVELSNEYMRFFYDGAVLLDDNDDEVWIQTSYLTEHLFQLQYHQVGDVMWITHPFYAPRKLTRTSATSFALTIIPFKTGPFMIRNDLIDPDNPSNITMTSSTTGLSVGTAEYSLTGHGDGVSKYGINHIRDNWWDGTAAHGVNGSQADYCGGGRMSDGRTVYITYTVTYADAIATLTEIIIDYICMSHDQTTDLTLNTYTKRGLRVCDSAGTWTVVIDPEVVDADFSATSYHDKPGSLIGYDSTATITGTWTDVTKIEIYLYAVAGEHSTACAIFNVNAGENAYIPGTLTASSDYFEDGMAGTLFSLIHQRSVTILTLNAVGYSAAIYAKGTFRFKTHGTWTGTVELQRNDNDAGWDTYRTFIYKNDGNVQESFVEDGISVQYRIYVHDGMTGDFGSDLTLNDIFREGIVKITSIGDIVTYEGEVVTYEDEVVILESATIANISVITPLELAEPTKRWSEGAWSDLRGFPTSVAFFEDRCIYGGMQTILPSGAKLLTLWLSHSGDYENFSAGLLAADSYSVTVATSEDIAWVEATENLLVATFAEVWKITSNRMEQFLTPTNTVPKYQFGFGGNEIQPVDAGVALLYTNGQQVKELTFDSGADKFNAPDLSALAEHLTSSARIVNMALQSAPDCILWCVLDTGDVIILVYDREQNCVGWAKVPIDGDVYSVCITPGEYEDNVTLAVFRTITGETITWEDITVTYEDEIVTDVIYAIYIERFAPRVFGTLIEDAFFVDCGKTFLATTATTTVTGATHLVGETVAILADGVVQDSKVVDANGEFELDTAANKVQYGIAYKSKLMPMKPVVNTQMGSSAASIVSCKEMGISFLNTMDAQYGVADDKLFDINYDDPRWQNNADSIAGLFTGTVSVSVDGGFSIDNNLIISTDAPLPCIVRALIPKVEVTGR
jgi:hypothetical protein